MYSHVSVLLDKTIELLNVKQGGMYIDCTTGGGGHSLAIAGKLENSGRLICFDVDSSAIAAAKERLCGYEVQFVNANFADMAHYIEKNKADGIVMDLGVSSHQLDTAERGFSFHEDAPLNMRMAQIPCSHTVFRADYAEQKSAFDVVNDYPAEELVKILYEYGEEKHARGIVNGIVAARNAAKIETTGQLAEIIRCNVPISVRNAKNPCRKTFQAIRIEVNDELGNLEKGLSAGFEILRPGGRFAVITFHSIEDRLVKKKFAEFTAGCDCPRNLPLCVCAKTPKAVHITRKPEKPCEDEISGNRRARSAKLRVIEKTED
jgi:16S rRNA (cytosine1402-N4)-methyltransferase